MSRRVIVSLVATISKLFPSFMNVISAGIIEFQSGLRFLSVGSWVNFMKLHAPGTSDNPSNSQWHKQS